MDAARLDDLDNFRLDRLADAVDHRLSVLPAMREPGRLFAVRAAPGADGGFALVLLATGDPRDIVRRPTVPRDILALAHSALGWSAPMPEDGTLMLRPSRHPMRRRAHSLTLIGGASELWAVVRIGDDERHIWPDGEGLIPDRLRAAWRRRKG
jgi:hypothetical protein